MPDAVELTAPQAWLVADLLDAGDYPWFLAITPPAIPQLVDSLRDELHEELVGLSVIGSDGKVDGRVATWVRAVCSARQYFEARTVRDGASALQASVYPEQLRSFAAHQDGVTVVAMRAGGLVTFTQLGSPHPRTLASVFTAGLPGAAPAKFRQFALPTQAGAQADERLRAGVEPDAVLAELAIPEEARDTLATMLSEPRSFVEISTGSPARSREGVGIGVLDTVLGRVLVTPSQNPDGERSSTFSPGTDAAIASAVQRLAEDTQGGHWFPRGIC